MQIGKFFKVLLLLVCVGIYGYSAINTNSGQEYSVSVDTGVPLLIAWPFEVAVVGDMGEKGLRIGPKRGRGWCGEAGGEATYKFYIPEAGKYHIWGYCLWFDECANAIFAQVDGLDKAILGNDPVYKQWHWVRGFAMHLEKGTHTLVLSNHSDNISVQKVLFTNSGHLAPEDCSMVFSDIFYDGFDGCDWGRFESWTRVSGEWKVLDPKQQACFIENALVGKSEDSSLIIYRGADWSDYSLNVAVKSVISESSNGSAGICFGVKDENQYHQLTWRDIDGAATVRMEVSRRATDETEVLASFEVPWEANTWHQVEIRLNANGIAVRVDDAEPIETSVDDKVAGGIGFRLEGKIVGYFDDVHVRTSDEI